MQRFVSNAIAKTCNFPSTATEEDVAKAYQLAWELGCKGLTVYVAGSREKVVLETASTAQQKQDLAAILNLCGAGLANAYARRGFKMAPGARCGDHEAAVYVAKVDDMMKAFRKLAAN